MHKQRYKTMMLLNTGGVISLCKVVWITSEYVCV